VILIPKGRGYIFQDEVQTSCQEQHIWFFRVKDVNIPPDLRMRVRVSENPYDSLIYMNGFLFPTELKSTKGKSLPFKNIKDHQIKSLIESNTYEKTIIPGFLINYSDISVSYFLHIDDFVKYQELAANNVKSYEEVKINESSVSLEYVEKFGMELNGIKKQVKFRWYINYLLDELIKKYS
jgi:penicillin-binding protein-related factor A (putative recombinase)